MTTLESTDELTADVLIEAIQQARDSDVTATTPVIVGALFTGDHGSGSPEYKRTRELLNDLAEDGTLTKEREGNKNAYDLPEGDGMPEDDLPALTEEHVDDGDGNDLDELADEADTEVPDADPDDQEDDDTERSGVTPASGEVQQSYTLADHVPDERAAVAQEFIERAANDHNREAFSPPLPRRLDVDDPAMREFRIVRRKGRLKSPASGLVVTDDAVGDGLLPEDADPSTATVYARSPYCGSMRKLKVTEHKGGIRLQFRSFNLPKNTPRTRVEEFLVFDDNEQAWTWHSEDPENVQSDALARRAQAGVDPHYGGLDEDGNPITAEENGYGDHPQVSTDADDEDGDDA